MRLFGFISLMVILAFATPSQANRAVINQVNAYLNSITTLEGEFVQIAPDKVITEGSFVIRRPGRILFRYAPPNTLRIIADGFWVALIDTEENTSPDRYPLSETPLNLILRENVDLNEDGAIKTVEARDGKYRLVAVDPSGEAQGSITLVFSTKPLRLTNWVVTDAQGYETNIALRNVNAGGKVDMSKFNIPNNIGNNDYRLD